MDHEGHQVARWFTSRGVAAAIVKYRLGPRYRHPAPLQDVLRAIRLVRSRAAELGIKPDRIGVMGFSAGGHLASSAATLFDRDDAKVADGLEAVSSRPDFAVLGYPVIVFGADVTHKGSQRNLLGDAPSAELVARLSTDRQVTAQTPPTFLFHTSEDAGVPPQNSVAFYLALKKAGVPAELHIYEKGATGSASRPAIASCRRGLTGCLDGCGGGGCWIGKGALAMPRAEFSRLLLEFDRRITRAGRSSHGCTVRGPRQSGILHRAPADEVFLDDALQHGRVAVAIPRPFGIDDGDRAVLADAQAIGLGAEHAVVRQAELDQPPLQVVPRDNGPLAVAALRLGLIAAEKNVPLGAAKPSLSMSAASGCSGWPSGMSRLWASRCRGHRVPPPASQPRSPSCRYISDEVSCSADRSVPSRV